MRVCVRVFQGDPYVVLPRVTNISKRLNNAPIALHWCVYFVGVSLCLSFSQYVPLCVRASVFSY